MPAAKPTFRPSKRSVPSPPVVKAAPVQTRPVKARILTPVGWMEAIFEIPKLQNFFEWLEHSGAFIRVPSILLPDGRTTRQNFALQRHAILAVLPDNVKDAEQNQMVAARQVVHDVSCLATFGVLHGLVLAHEGVRLADYLLHHAGFIVLRDCTVERVGQARAEKPMPAVLINAEHVVGVTEERPPVVIGPAAATLAPPRRPRRSV